MGRFDNMKDSWQAPAAEKPAAAASDFELMPDGVYTCELYDISERSPKKGGEAFSVTLKVVDGDYTNRRVWDWINFNLPHSPQATQIGQETFRSLCRACGFDDAPPNELGELIGCELKVRLGKRSASGDYPAKNIVRDYITPDIQQMIDAAPGSDDDTQQLF